MRNIGESRIVCTHDLGHLQFPGNWPICRMDFTLKPRNKAYGADSYYDLRVVFDPVDF